MKLEVFQDGQLLQEVPVDENELWVGRDQGCVIRLEDRAISRRHALLKSTDRGIEFEKKSKFGWVKVNGQDATQITLKSGDRVEMGPYEIRVSGADAPAGASASADVIQMAAPANTPNGMTVGPVVESPIQLNDPLTGEPVPGVEALPAIEIPASNPPEHTKVLGQTAEIAVPSNENGNEVGLDVQKIEKTSAGGNTGAMDYGAVSSDGATKVFGRKDPIKAILQFNDGQANVSQYELNDNEIAIGRSQQCHVVLEDKKSSRKHAIIRREGDKYYLKDLGSANGTQVNGSRVDDVELQSGDQIQIGETAFAFKIVQADYEIKKEGFIAVPQHEMPPPPPVGSHRDANVIESLDYIPPDVGNAPTPQPEFSAPKAEKKSLIGKALDRYRAMNTRQQIIWGILVLASLYVLMMDEEGDHQPARLNTGLVQKSKATKPGDRKPGEGQSFDALTAEQKRYIETQYQLSFDLYKNREYDKALLEVGKIFSLVQDYKNAREIEAFSREGKRKLEAQEEERKRKEQERQSQLKLQSLLEQADMLMSKKRFHEAEALFPEIELIQPENAAVNEWRKIIMAEGERLDREREEQERQQALVRQGWSKLQRAVDYKKDHDYQTALDELNEIDELGVQDRKLKNAVRDEDSAIRGRIAAERDPLLVQGKELEQSGQLAEAYKAYEKAHTIDPDDKVSEQGMARIHGNLTARAKALYIEGVFAESYNDLETAERSYREILSVVPKDDEYHAKAELRLKRVTSFRRPAGSASNAGSGESPQ
ncbi:MAG: FHA domain-containing protein [Bdellovibrionales bacterium]|nr:FHA domain-containing protein [Bdellovibrionales bacterium]